MRHTPPELEFGKLVKTERRNRGWTIQEFRDRLEASSGRTVSPAYVTRIEQYGEVPGPELICIIADVFGFDHNETLKRARQAKVRRFNEGLEKKYREAAGLYRKQQADGRKKD